MSSVDMYAGLLYKSALPKRTEPNILRPLFVGANVDFRHKRRRIIVTIRLEPRRELSETIVIITLQMIPLDHDSKERSENQDGQYGTN